MVVSLKQGGLSLNIAPLSSMDSHSFMLPEDLLHGTAEPASGNLTSVHLTLIIAVSVTTHVLKIKHLFKFFVYQGLSLNIIVLPVEQ